MDPRSPAAVGTPPPFWCHRTRFSSALAVGLVFIIFYSGLVAYRSKDDAATVAFVESSFHRGLLLLFCCLWIMEIVPPGSAWKDRMKAFVWALTTMFTFSFAYMVIGTAGLALPVALLVWFMAAAIGIGAFSSFFSCRGRYLFTCKHSA
jgi:hypothetical protein